jgi:hypothetical protein
VEAAAKAARDERAWIAAVSATAVPPTEVEVEVAAEAEVAP